MHWLSWLSNGQNCTSEMMQVRSYNIGTWRPSIEAEAHREHAQTHLRSYSSPLSFQLHLNRSTTGLARPVQVMNGRQPLALTHPFASPACRASASADRLSGRPVLGRLRAPASRVAGNWPAWPFHCQPRITHSLTHTTRQLPSSCPRLYSAALLYPTSALPAAVVASACRFRGDSVNGHRSGRRRLRRSRQRVTGCIRPVHQTARSPLKLEGFGAREARAERLRRREDLVHTQFGARLCCKHDDVVPSTATTLSSFGASYSASRLQTAPPDEEVCRRRR